MTTSRRQSFAARPTSTDWPAELADPVATIWASAAKTEAWLEANGVDRMPHQIDVHPTPAGRRVAAIRAWATAHHPSERWPLFVDQLWMNSSGLRAVEQAVDREVYRESLTNPGAR